MPPAPAVRRHVRTQPARTHTHARAHSLPFNRYLCEKLNIVTLPSVVLVKNRQVRVAGWLARGAGGWVGGWVGADRVGGSHCFGKGKKAMFLAPPPAGLPAAAAHATIVVCVGVCALLWCVMYCVFGCVCLAHVFFPHSGMRCVCARVTRVCASVCLARAQA